MRVFGFYMYQRRLQAGVMVDRGLELEVGVGSAGTESPGEGATGSQHANAFIWSLN